VSLLLASSSSWTNKLITAKDHASVQLNIGHLDENGVYITGQYTTFALSGKVRAQVCGEQEFVLKTPPGLSGPLLYR
jgi:small subunit ribosomal protein S21e